MHFLSYSLVASLVLSAADAQPQAKPDANTEHGSGVLVDRAGVYAAEGTAIVRRGGRRYHNRPLYCSKTSAIVLAGDLPHIRFAYEPYVCGCLMMAVDRSGKSKWLHDFSEVESRYQDARMTWRLSDPSLSGLTVTLEVVPMVDAAGLCARLAVQGAQPGDRLIWAYGGATRSAAGVNTTLDPTVNTALTARGFVPEDCRGNTISFDGDTFILSPPGSDASQKAMRRKVAGRCSAASSRMRVAGANAWSDPVALAAGNEKAELPLALGVAPLTQAESEAFWAVESFDGDTAGDVARLRDPLELFRLAVHRGQAVGRQIEVATPDERFDATVSAACAALDGIIRPPYIMHGGMSWNMPYMGWRTMYGPTALGWHDAVRQAAAMYIGSQEKADTKKAAHAAPNLGYSAEAGDSRFFGLGRLLHVDNHWYDMQSLLFDMVIHAWRWTGNPELEKLLRGSLDLHLEWMRACFDPDGDGLYESYQNTAEVDQVWYNGGGTAEETAYAYTGHLAAVDLARIAKDAQAVEHHKHIAEKIRKSLLQSLWIPSKGYVGAYREQSGLKRLHEDSWLYSIFLPIDAGLLTDRQSVQALHYTEWGLERVKMPLGGERCWTSNWVPTGWSNRMLWPAHAYSLALAYDQAGLPDDGWEMMKGGFLESAFNKTVPGGFDSDTTGTDFHDVSSMFARAVVEGLFGYKPDYPNGIVRCAPRFPSKWDRASIKSPDFSLSFKRGPGVDEYALTLIKAAEIGFSVPVRARKVARVEVDGGPADWEATPGYGHSLVSVRLPKRESARLKVQWDDALPQYAPTSVDGAAGEPIQLKAKQGKIVEVVDPQKVLSQEKIEDGAVNGVWARNAGHHLVLALVDVSGLRQWQTFKARVSDPQTEAGATAKSVGAIPSGAKWTCLDIGDHFNGDIRTIYKQKYLSPRPQTCSVRIGSDGYSSWPFYYWGVKVPEINLSNVGKMLDSDGRLVTPQGVPFAWRSSDRNIAFTSQWDNWPRSITFPVGQKGQAVWLLVCGSTNPMQGGIVNAEIRLKYSDGAVEKLEIIPPFSFWSLCPLPQGQDYDYKHDAFVLPKTPPATVQLGGNCRAVLLNRRLREGVAIESLTLEALSQEVIIGLMAVTIML